MANEFLRLNGWPIAVRIGTPERQYEEVGGERGRAFDGTPLSTRQALKKALSFETPPLSSLEARALSGVLLGEGRYWPFDEDFWDVKGLNFDSGTASIITSDVVYGDGAVLLETDFSVGTGIDDEPWSIMLWRGVSQDEDTTATAFISSWFPSTFGAAPEINWAHYVVRSDGAKWRNAFRADEIDTDWITMSDEGTMTLFATASAFSGANAFDDLVVLPFLAPEEMVEGIVSLDRPYGRIPRIDVQGLATDDLVLEMEADVPVAPYQVWGEDGTLHRDGQIVRGRLFEA